MRAVIRKVNGTWTYDVRRSGPAMRSTGSCRSWADALSCALGELRWMARLA